MNLCTFRTLAGQPIHLIHENNHHYFYFTQGEERRKIEQIISDFNIHSIPTSQLLKCIPLTYSQLVELNDGSYKLYFRTRGLLGGMMSEKNLKLCKGLRIGDDTIDDVTVAENILKVAPINSQFSSIAVQTIDGFKFPSAEIPLKKVRQIIIQVGNWDWFVNVLRALVSEPIHGLNTNRAVAAIIGSKEDADLKEMVKAYKKNYKFEIHVSYDFEYFYFNPIADNTTSLSEGLLTKCVIS